MTKTITAGTAVLVDNLLRFAEANTKGLLEIEPSWTPPLIFCRAHVENRRVGAQGVVQHQSPGHYGYGAWVVRHDDDGALAVYHTSELKLVENAAAAVDDTPEAVVPVAPAEPAVAKLVKNFRGCDVEIYVGANPTTLSAHLLIAALPAGKSREEQLKAPTQQALRDACGSRYHDALETVGELDPLQTIVVGDAPESQMRPVFGHVLFINGGQPTMDAIDMALSIATEAGAETVILPARDFIVARPGETLEPAELLEFFDVLLESSGSKLKTLKVVI